MSTEKPKIACLPNGPYYLLNDLTPRVIPNIQKSEGDPCTTITGHTLVVHSPRVPRGGFVPSHWRSFSTSASKQHAGQPGSKLRPHGEQHQSEKLYSDKRNNAAINIRGLYFGRRNTPQIEKRKAKRRRQERSL